MKRLATAVAIVMLLCANVMAGSIRTTYNSKAIWRGMEIFDSGTGVVRTEVDTDVGPLDFAAAFWLPDDAGNVEDQRLDGALTYSGDLSIFEYVVGYGYYYFPEQSTHDATASSDLQEIFAGLGLPIEIGPVTLTPSYTAVQTWSSNSDQINLAQGALHIVGIEANIEELTLSAEAIYNDGVEYKGRTDHDWSHAVFGASLELPVTETITFSPGVYYEIACDKSVVRDNETWFSMRLSTKF